MPLSPRALDAGPWMRHTSPVYIRSDACMGKYLLLIVGAILVYRIVRAALRRRSRAAAQHPDNAAPEDMVRCVTCGVHLPRGESLRVRGQFYCGVDHQRRHDQDN